MDSFDPSHPLTMMFWFATGPKAIEPTSCGRNPLESKAKSLSSFHATYLRHFVIVTESCDTLGSSSAVQGLTRRWDPAFHLLMQMGTVSSLHPLLRGPPPFLGFAIFIWHSWSSGLLLFIYF